ncbi:c-type cytochrome [Pseudophaeobacter flagellatus]|uniref:c-type cytochrome n=1 Tax=Pseudophaeobacter flagellatus TaxID=2899119 RepID=UPI001E4BC287|nr:cytochrome c [Pseudophaeobacter flagellatus]MCD9149317.1 cytochrome c [Pseudophaeobacter flagellatus]
MTAPLPRPIGANRLALHRLALRPIGGLVSALALCLLMLAADLNAGSAIITDKHVRDRLTLMQGQKAALTTLGDMIAGRRTFSPAQARAARRSLISSTRKITKRFKKQRMEPNSHARPEIWSRWQDFTQRAETAQIAAKQLNVGSLNGLRRSIPAMMQACHSCHQSYRRTPNQAVTH